MVKLTIFIEGGASFTNDSPDIQTIDSSAVFREGFYNLFAQHLHKSEFDIVIEPIGSVSQAKVLLKKTTADKDTILLIDLDAPKEQKQQRITDNFEGLNNSKLFFMVQEMEAWILSQPDKIVKFAQQRNLTRKREDEKIEDNQLLKELHPEEITSPSEKLDTILRQYFDEQRIRRGKIKRKGKRYSKTKDGFVLIGLLDLRRLISTFDEVQNMLKYIKQREAP